MGPQPWRCRRLRWTSSKSLQKKGKIRNLGITNWDRQQIRPFLDAGFDIVSAQVQYSVLDRRPANGLADWAADHDMQLLCYGTLAGGFLTEPMAGPARPRLCVSKTAA